jgi:Rps23 Pro-64 3,4-dihydroxylase Tpa1-like proline 4-hydroxylase
MLNDILDWDAARADYAANGYVRVENALDPQYAELVAQAVIQETNWQLCYLSDNGPVSIAPQELRSYPPEKAASINNEILTKAQSGFAYYYYRSALQNSSNPKHSQFFNYLRSDNFLSFARFLTGEPSIHTVNGQLTCYRPTCFLRRHNDTAGSIEERAAAYVFGFTPQWEADWGGLLHIMSEDFRIIDSHKPAFNTLTVFRVPTWHFVSQVANYAKGARYTATGWFLMP